MLLLLLWEVDKVVVIQGIEDEEDGETAEGRRVERLERVSSMGIEADAVVVVAVGAAIDIVVDGG